MLEIKNINAGYGKLQILWDVSFKVMPGEFVALLGSNGVGKTTILRAISGILKIDNGEINFLGNRIDKIPTHQIPKLGLSYVTEDGALFAGMTVQENLELGAFIISDKKRRLEILDGVYDLFPRLQERSKQLAGTLSGGERRMLSIAKGLMADPKILLVDEPSLGLAPNLASSVFESLVKLNQQGVTILLVEQNVKTTLKITNRAYVLDRGKVVIEGLSEDLMKDEHIRKSYLGLSCS
jgi:branched-chain amino acid transport system ATP-binding protein